MYVSMCVSVCAHTWSGVHVHVHYAGMHMYVCLSFVCTLYVHVCTCASEPGLRRELVGTPGTDHSVEFFSVCFRVCQELKRHRKRGALVLFQIPTLPTQGQPLP